MNKLTKTQKRNLNLPSCETYYDMDGFIYQQVLSSEVSDLMNMSKEVYELHDDNTESLVDGIVNESSTYGIEVGFLDELEAKAMFLGINKGLGLPTNEASPSRLVTIYYNDVFVSEEPNEIYANCPYVNVPIEDAIEYADRMIENGDWDAYCIPELCNHEVKFTEVLFQRDGDAEKTYTKDELYAIMRSFVEDTRGDKPWVDADDEWFGQFTKTNTEHMVGMVEAMYEAIDEFEGMYNHCAGEDKDHYETRIAQLNNVLNLLNSLK